MNLANKLTIFRMILVPIILIVPYLGIDSQIGWGVLEASIGIPVTMLLADLVFIIASITDTFLESYGADYIYISVEEKPLTTPYAVYDGALQKCMPQELLEMEKETEEIETEEGNNDGRD